MIFSQLNVRALIIYVVALVATHYLLVAQSIHGKGRSLQIAPQEQISPDVCQGTVQKGNEILALLHCNHVGYFCKEKIWFLLRIL